MKLQKSTRYALHAALELARGDGRPIPAKQIATRYEIPENVVAKVLQQLVREGVASGARGVGGGYCLARSAESVSLQSIIDIFEPSPAPDACMLRDLPGEECSDTGGPTCRLMGLFEEVDETVRATFSSVSLATVAGH